MAARNIQDLRQLIGRRVLHQGIPCLVVEFLEHEPALVLEASGPREGIQDNQYGDPHRRVAEVFTIPLYETPDSENLHPELLALRLVLE
jgi:hypothetical protein